MSIITPKQLAHRWNCSVFHIYKLCRENLIPHFRLGTRIIRFQTEEIENYECRNSSSTEVNGASIAVQTQALPFAGPSGRLIEQRLNEGQQTFRTSSFFVPPVTGER